MNGISPSELSDAGFKLDGSNNCVPEKEDLACPRPSGYRKRPGNTCKGGNLDAPKTDCAGTTHY